MLTVLYICTDVEFAGSSKSLYNMIESLDGQVRPVVLLSAKGGVYDYFTKLGIQCIVQPFFYLWEKPKKLKTVLHHPSKSVWYNYWKIDRECVKTVTRQLQGIKIDVVHSNTSVITIGVALAKALNAKHVWHIREYLDIDHGINVFGGRNRLRRLINKADARIAITDSVNQYWRLSSQATYVMTDAVRYISEIECVHQKQKYFLFASAYLSENKGTLFAINAFAKSNLAKHGYTLKMLGRCDKVDKQKLEQLICSYGLESSIELLGFQTDVKSYYTNAAGYLMTSKCEALGRVTVDAMFYGCPVLARATGGSAEIVQHGYNGYLFLTEEECAQLMNTIVSEETITQQMVQNAIAVAKENFSVEYYGDKVYQVYLSIL